MLFLRPADWAIETPRGWAARWCWTWGLVCFLVHLAMAFHYFHHWSHAHAFERTREVSGVGEGIYVSYLFTWLWGADVAYWWLSPGGYAARSRWIDRTLQAFMLFIVINGTIVFETRGDSLGGRGGAGAVGGRLVGQPAESEIAAGVGGLRQTGGEAMDVFVHDTYFSVWVDPLAWWILAGLALVSGPAIGWPLWRLFCRFVQWRNTPRAARSRAAPGRGLAPGARWIPRNRLTRPRGACTPFPRRGELRGRGLRMQGDSPRLPVCVGWTRCARNAGGQSHAAGRSFGTVPSAPRLATNRGIWPLAILPIFRLLAFALPVGYDFSWRCRKQGAA